MKDGTHTETAEQIENSKPWLFKKGVSGNPSGKPKGTVSLKKFAQKYIQGLSEQEKLEFMEGLNKIDIWKMAEGMPETKTDITSNGEGIQQLLVQFIDGNENNSNTK